MRTTHRLASALTGALLLSGVARAEPTAQQQTLAARLFDDASKLTSAGRTDEACAKLTESYRLDPELGTLLYLGECQVKLGKTASAWTSFKDALDMAAARNDRRAGKIRERLAGLEKSLANLVIVVGQAEPEGLEVREDGAVVGRAAWGSPIPIDPGEHHIEATAAGIKPRDVVVTVGKEPQTYRVELPPLEKLPPSAGPAPAAPTSGPPAPLTAASGQGRVDSGGASWFGAHQRFVAGTLGGLGLAGIVVGSVFGLSAKSAYGESEPHCTGNHCDDAGHADRQRAFARATVANVAFTAGGALLAGGVVLWLTAPPRDRPARGATAVLPSASSQGVSLTLRRTF